MDSRAGNDGIELSSISHLCKTGGYGHKFHIYGEREVKELNKKVLMATLILVTVTVLATPFVGTVQAKRTKEPYYVEYGVKRISPPTIQKEVGVVQMARGTVYQGAYDGPVGVGTMTAELIIMKATTKVEKGETIFRNILEITSGPYGAFTLKGFTHYKYDADGFVSGKTVLQGKSEVGQVTIIAEKGFKSPPNPIWEEGWIIVP